MSYAANKIAARTVNNEPTMTDQAAARDTDINVIVKQFTQHGQMPGKTGQPLYEDWTDMPDDLREYIETSRAIAQHHARLPEQLRSMSTEELLALTPQELRNKLTPPETKPEEKTE